MPDTFGDVVARARKDDERSQKALAEQLEISAQYLNDIERGRRNPPTGAVLEHLARLLRLDLEYLQFLADQWPADIRDAAPDEAKFKKAMKAFRRDLR